MTVFGKMGMASIQPFRGQVLVARGGRDTLIEQLSHDRATHIWFYRAAGGFVLWVALSLVLSPLLKLVTWVPILGTLVQSATTVVTLVAAFAATAAFVFLGWAMPFFTRLFGGLVG